MTERLFKQNGSTSGNLPQVHGLNKLEKPEEQTTQIESSKDFRLHRFDLNNRSDTNTKADLRDSQPDQRNLFDERKPPKPGKDEMPYDLDQVADLSNHFANGFDLLKKAIEYLARKQRRTEGAMQAHGMLPPEVGEDGRPLAGADGAPGASGGYGLSVGADGGTTILGKDGKPIPFNAKDLRGQVMQNTKDVADHENRLAALQTKTAKQNEKLQAMFGDVFADSEEEDAAADPDDPNSPTKGKGAAAGNLFEARMQKLDKKIQHLADVLGSTMSKKDRAKLLAGLADIDEQDMSLDGEMSSRLSPEDSLSARSDRRGFNSLMLDFKEEHQHEMQGLWAAIKKLEDEKMDRLLCEKQLKRLKRKVEEELGSLGDSTDPETIVTPGGTIIEKPTDGSGPSPRTKESKVSEGRSGSKVGGRALQGLDVDVLKEMTAQLPAMQGILEEFSKHGGYAVISLMKEQIAEIQKQNAAVITRDEYNKIISTSKVLQNELKMAQSEVDFFRKSLDQVKDDLYRLQKAPSEEEFLVMRTRVDAAENSISQQGKKVGECQRIVKQLKTQFGKGGDFESLIEQIEKINEQLVDHLHEFSTYKDATKEELAEMTDALARKADKSELEQLQALLQKQLTDQTQLVRDTCASKEETTRKLNQLSRKVKELFELVGNSGGVQEDGMLTKRHIGPNACASCDKTLVNMQGLQAEYSPHKKMPYREHADRIARYGAGFSKMLSTLQPSGSGGAMPASHGHSPSGKDNSQSAANLNFQSRHSPMQSSKNLQNSNPQLLTVFQNHKDGSHHATSMRHQFQIWEEDSHGLIPTKLHPDHLRHHLGEQSTYQKGSGHLNSTMMQTMHTMPAGIGAGAQSGYGPGSTQEAPQTGEGNNFKTSIGFFNNQNSGSTPINGQPSNAPAQTLAQRQQIQQIEAQRRRHSSVVRGPPGQGNQPYGVKVQHQPGVAGGNPDLSPMNLALRMKRNARSPDQQKGNLERGAGGQHTSKYGVSEGRKINEEPDQQAQNDAGVLPQLTQRKDLH